MHLDATRLRESKGGHTRSFTLFEPDLLLGVDAYVNDVPGRFGLKALKFRGSPEMGEILLGDWQDEFARPTQMQRMLIDGKPCNFG